ncbi:MAG: hypothetical protein AB8B48_06245 [Pseudomonadales bacterium]
MNSEISNANPVELIEGDVSYPTGYLRAAMQLLSSTQRELRIYSELLEADVYGSEDFVTQLSSMIRANRRSHARVLVSARAELAGRSHRLLDLARTLPSLCQCRVISEPADRYREDYVLADRSAYVAKKAKDENAARFAPSDRAGAVDRAEHFDYLWSRASASAELRYLSI